MLHFQLPIGIISEFTESETLVGPLCINLLSQLVLLIVERLQDIFLTISTRLAFFVELRLEIGKIVFGSVYQFVRLGHAIFDFLSDRILQRGKPFISQRKLLSVMLPHCIDLSLEVVAKLFQLVLKLGLEGLQCIFDSLLFRSREISVCLDLACDVLELGLELLPGLDLLPEHDIVVLVHLNHLVVHVLQRLVVVLMDAEAAHVLLGQYLFLAHRVCSNGACF